MKGEVEVVIYLGQSLWLTWMFKRIESIQFRKGSVMNLILTFMLLGKSLDTCIFIFFLCMCSICVCVLLVFEPSVSHMLCKCSLYSWSKHPHLFKEVFIFMYVVVLPTCITMNHVYVWCFCQPEEEV